MRDKKRDDERTLLSIQQHSLRQPRLASPEQCLHIGRAQFEHSGTIAVGIFVPANELSTRVARSKTERGCIEG